ncbi:hypothetical protein [Roseivirga pacifica]|uniref:hypothetical protein n=1 Tax=Roseivirga pacifica TaxID=1267423 RepID=UPI00227B1C0E|nr:hypothetical protein [Roseivirga pacifica]
MTDTTKKSYLHNIKEKMAAEMPKVMEEIAVYEKKLKSDTLTKQPKISPQFNG